MIGVEQIDLDSFRKVFMLRKDDTSFTRDQIVANIEHLTLTELDKIGVTRQAIVSIIKPDLNAITYVHPASHPIDMITGAAVVAKTGRYKDLVDAPVAATPTTDGLMSKEDKGKMDGIEKFANNYKHPDTHPVSMISGLETVAMTGNFDDLKFKPDLKKVATTGSYYDLDVQLEKATSIKDGLMPAEIMNRIENNTIWTHPLKHSTDEIADLRNVAKTGNYYDLDVKLAPATETDDGIMTKEDKALINILIGNVDAMVNLATEDKRGLMSADDKKKLNSLALVAITGNYKDLINKPTFNLATPTTDGLMSMIDKATITKLKLVATSGNYDDLMNKPENATELKGGLMSSADKIILRGLKEKLDTTNTLTNDEKSKFDAMLSYINDKIIPRAESELATGTRAGFLSTGDFVKLSDLNAAVAVVSNTKQGLMSAADKVAFDSLKDFVNNKVKLFAPEMMATHEHAGFLSKEDYDTIHNLDNSISLVTPTKNGLMHATDKVAFDTMRNDVSALQTLAVPASKDNIGLLTKEDYAILHSTATKDVGGVGGANGLMSKEDKARLDDVFTRVVNSGSLTLDEKTAFDNMRAYIQKLVEKVPGTAGVMASSTLDGFLSKEDYNKIQNPLSYIPTAQTDRNGLMSKEDKTTFDSLNSYITLLKNKDESVMSSKTQAGFMSAAHWDKIENIDTYLQLVTTAKNGLMSKEDKIKLDSQGTIYFGATAPTNPGPKDIWIV